MPKSLNERLAALEALEAPQPDPRVMNIPPLSEDELDRLIDAGLRSGDLHAWNGSPFFFGADPYWRAVAQQADDLYWQRYEADPERFALHIPITPDEARTARAGILAGRVSVIASGESAWMDIRSSVDIGTPLHAATKAASNALICVSGYLRYYDEAARTYVMPMPLDQAAVCQLLDEWSGHEATPAPCTA